MHASFCLTNTFLYQKQLKCPFFSNILFARVLCDIITIVIDNYLVNFMDGEDTYNNLRVASFSCYLNSKEESAVVNLARGTLDSPSPVMSPKETPRLINLGRSKNKEPEISVFAADKYFNMKNEHHGSKYELEKERGVDLHLLQQKIRPKTPSITSKGSSSNSRSVLLQSLHENPSQTKRGFGLKFLPFFSCQGPCLQKKAVYINESINYGVLHGSLQISKMDEQFSFPVLKSGLTNLKVTEHLKEEKVLPIDPRNSIEVFGSARTKKGNNIAMNMERNLSILTWDAIPKVQSLVTTSFGSSGPTDDMASDASSDLFEIENISGVDCAVLSRQESCNMSSDITPTTQYAPSEASIQWSVVTASAADYSSVVSDYEDSSVSVKGRMVATDRTTYSKRDLPKSGPRKLLGCRNQKAVRITESTYRRNEKFER